MKTLTKLFIAVICLFTITMPCQSLAQKITLSDVQTKIQPLRNGEFQIHFQFSLPDFDEVDLQNINIDRAVLEFEVMVKTAGSTELNMLDVLAAGINKREPLRDLAYNENPVRARVNRTKIGTEKVKVDISQLFRNWLHHGLENNGIILVSHRRLSKKIFRTDKVRAGAQLRPSVTVFYTILDE